MVPFQFGKNKEAFGVDLYALVQVLKIFEQIGETGREYAIFSASEAAPRQIQTDERGPGQRYAVEAIEVAGRLLLNNHVALQ